MASDCTVRMCAGCGGIITDGQGSYTSHRNQRLEDFHSECGDPFGIKAKDAEIERLQGRLGRIAKICQSWDDDHINSYAAVAAIELVLDEPGDKRDGR